MSHSRVSYSNFLKVISVSVGALIGRVQSSFLLSISLWKISQCISENRASSWPTTGHIRAATTSNDHHCAFQWQDTLLLSCHVSSWLRETSVTQLHPQWAPKKRTTQPFHRAAPFNLALINPFQLYELVLLSLCTTFQKSL